MPFWVVETRSCKKSKNSGNFCKNGFPHVTLWPFFRQFPDFFHFWDERFEEFLWFLKSILLSIPSKIPGIDSACSLLQLADNDNDDANDTNITVVLMWLMEEGRKKEGRNKEGWKDGRMEGRGEGTLMMMMTMLIWAISMTDDDGRCWWWWRWRKEGRKGGRKEGREEGRKGGREEGRKAGPMKFNDVF